MKETKQIASEEEQPVCHCDVVWSCNIGDEMKNIYGRDGSIPQDLEERLRNLLPIAYLQLLNDCKTIFRSASQKNRKHCPYSIFRTHIEVK